MGSPSGCYILSAVPFPEVRGRVVEGCFCFPSWASFSFSPRNKGVIIPSFQSALGKKWLIGPDVCQRFTLDPPGSIQLQLITNIEAFGVMFSFCVCFFACFQLLPQVHPELQRRKQTPTSLRVSALSTRHSLVQ